MRCELDEKPWDEHRADAEGNVGVCHDNPITQLVDQNNTSDDDVTCSKK